MSAEVQAGAGGRGFGMMGKLQAQISDSLRTGSEEARGYAERIIARLDDIRASLDSIKGEESERQSYTKSVAAFAAERLSEGRPGYIETIERIAATAEAATAVDLFVGSASNAGFRHRLNFGAAGRDQAAVEIDVPEGSAIVVQTGAGAASVNVQIKRQRV